MSDWKAMVVLFLGVCSERVGCAYGRCGTDDGDDGIGNRGYEQIRRNTYTHALSYPLSVTRLEYSRDTARGILRCDARTEAVGTVFSY